MEKVSLLFMDLPDYLQAKISKILSESFPKLDFEVFFDKNRISPNRTVAFAYWKGDQGFSGLPEGVPLFILVESSSIERFPTLELSEQFEILDYASSEDPEPLIRGRLLIFMKRAMEFFEREGANSERKEESKGVSLSGLFSILRRIASVLTRPRSIPQPIECSPIIGGNWVRIRRLGFGSFGEVWLVQRKGTITEHLAVAKIPHDERANPKFLQEAEILKRLQDHPNAVKVIEVIHQDKKTIIIEEFVEGKTLQQLMDEGMTSTEKEQVFAQILDMVAYAHDHQIMHRDLKPENIIVTSRGIAKVLDFGTAKDVSRRSISSTVIGSRPYMAPEQIQGESRIASDVWALGVILYALATDYVPFYSENEKELMDMILESPPEPPSVHAPGLHPELESTILKCLEKNWKSRFRNARELQGALMEKLPSFGKGLYIPGVSVG
ncbi:MAG: serine/threonine protein kinase [Syntrophobacterales bacterium]|nr:serine/threonine protein kinase [Syntrophobacterales bacterium]